MSSHATASADTLVNSYTTGRQYGEAITALADGGWMVTWSGEGPGDDIGVFQQRYAANGHTVGPETLVNRYTRSYQGDASVTGIANGGWVVTWDSEEPGVNIDVFQQRYAANGNTVGSETLVNSYTTDRQLAGVTTDLADGGWVVIWQGEGPGDKRDGIFQQRYAADGTAMGSETLVDTHPKHYQSDPAATDLADGGWVVTWWGAGPGDNQGIFQQRYAANGHAKGPETLVTSHHKYAQFESSVTGLADGGWVVTWQSDKYAYLSYQQRYGADGHAMGSETPVSSSANPYQLTPRVTGLADGGWVATWFGFVGNHAALFQRRFLANGHAVGTDTQVEIDSQNSRGYPEIAGLADGGWVVTWRAGGHGDQSSIYQRHFAADIDGSKHANTLTGTGSDEYLIGHGGNDRLGGKGGDDVMVGGYGNDIYIVNSMADQVEELAGQGTDTVLASVSFTLSGSVENLVLTGRDGVKAVGNGMANHLIGNSGNDTIRGAAGNDTEAGGLGNDQLVGGAGADHFVFNTGHGKDTIKDFTATGSDHDIIDLRHVSGLSDFADLKAHHMSTHSGDVIIATAHGDTITLDGVAIKDLSAADFLF
jgi:Ca2+-binding RTX toxin-like protein